MANIRVDSLDSVYNGQSITFRSPADCSQITGLIVYYPDGDTTTSKTFQFADAHGNNVGSVSLFAEDVLVKVILDTDAGKAYVQNADTNAYLEGRFAFLGGKTGDIKETMRTDLGEDWLLCNCVGIPEGEYPALRELLPYNTDWKEAEPEDDYEYIAPIPNTHKWCRVKRKTGTGSSDYAWDKAEVYDAETRTSLTVECPLVVDGKTSKLYGITHDGTRYVLAAGCTGEITSNVITMHLYASDDLVEWNEIYVYTFTEHLYDPTDFTFDGQAYVLVEGFSKTESSENYVRYAWFTPTDLSKTTKSSSSIGGGYKEPRFKPCPPGYLSIEGDDEIVRAGTGEYVIYLRGTYSADGIAFFGDRYLITVAARTIQWSGTVCVFDLETETETEIDMAALCGYTSGTQAFYSWGCEYDQNTDEWVFYYGETTGATHYVSISGDADPTDETQYRVRELKTSQSTTEYLGQMSLNRAQWFDNAVRDPSVKYLPEQDGISYKYIYVGGADEIVPGGNGSGTSGGSGGTSIYVDEATLNDKLAEVLK